MATLDEAAIRALIAPLQQDIANVKAENTDIKQLATVLDESAAIFTTVLAAKDRAAEDGVQQAATTAAPKQYSVYGSGSDVPSHPYPYRWLISSRVHDITP